MSDTVNTIPTFQKDSAFQLKVAARGALIRAVLWLWCNVLWRGVFGHEELAVVRFGHSCLGSIDCLGGPEYSGNAASPFFGRRYGAVEECPRILLARLCIGMGIYRGGVHHSR